MILIRRIGGWGWGCVWGVEGLDFLVSGKGSWHGWMVVEREWLFVCLSEWLIELVREELAGSAGDAWSWWSLANRS